MREGHDSFKLLICLISCLAILTAHMPFTALASTSDEEGSSDGESNESNDGGNGGGNEGDGGNDDESPDPPFADEEPIDAVPAEEPNEDDPITK